MRHPYPSKEQAQIIVDLRHCSDSGARVAARRLLVDADTGAQAINGVNVGLIHNAKELPCIAA